MRCRTESVEAPRLGEGARLRMGGTLPPGPFLIHLREAGEEGPRPSGVSPLSARSAYSAGARGLSPEGSAAEAKRMRRQTAKDDRARRRRTGGTPSRAQGARQRAGGWFGPPQRRANAKGFARRYTGSIPPPGRILGEETREGKGLVAHPGPIYNAAREKNTVSHHPVL